jgi:hypothetical protein
MAQPVGAGWPFVVCVGAIRGAAVGMILCPRLSFPFRVLSQMMSHVQRLHCVELI